MKLLRFEKSNNKNKKYDAILKDSEGQLKKVSFGDINYQQYKDTTPLKLYSNLDHLNKKRKNLYYARHNKNYPKYSADWFSKTFLW